MSFSLDLEPGQPLPVKPKIEGIRIARLWRWDARKSNAWY
jgi:hypothetical protein